LKNKIHICIHIILYQVNFLRQKMRKLRKISFLAVECRSLTQNRISDNMYCMAYNIRDGLHEPIIFFVSYDTSDSRFYG